LNGIHHVSSLTRDAVANHHFYTQVLGLRLVKKSVNQDDPGTYHLFYADAEGSPGTDTTFFDFPGATRVPPGNNSITRTTFRIGSDDDLDYWVGRLVDHGAGPRGVYERNNRPAVDFVDPDVTELSLVVDAVPRPGKPWRDSPVPAPRQIHGLGFPVLTVPSLSPTDRFLTSALGLEQVDEYPEPGLGHFGVHVYAPDDDRIDTQIHVLVRDDLPKGRMGAGSVHHVALRVSDQARFDQWAPFLLSLGYENSGVIDRHWFRSIYVREPNGILFELATDEPGFAIDEDMETLGTRLALPPHLEPRRNEIESRLRPLSLTNEFRP
jgi:glyoxalase family protein